MKTVFFTIVSDDYYYPVGAHILVNSFRKFMPDIPLIVFRQDVIDKVFQEKGINFYMAKPTFAKLLVGRYDRIINIDADTVICGRLSEVLDTDWEVGGVWNYNKYENASFENITEEMYVQAGMVGSTRPDFWDTWESANKDAMKYLRQENDILNKIWYNDPKISSIQKKLIWDKDKNYLGCKSLGQEGQMYIEGNELMLNKEKVKAYHWAKGARLPKMQYHNGMFRPEVAEWLTKVSMEGRTEVHSGI
jgi:hypothetical protein